MTFFATASGLMIERVRSIAMCGPWSNIVGFVNPKY